MPTQQNRLQENAETVIRTLSRPHTRLKFSDLARAAGITKAALEECLPEARRIRPDLVFGKFDRTYWLSNTPTWYSNQTDLSKIMPMEGIFGIVSDTHMASIADRLDILEYAYDVFEQHDIQTVLHCGDMTDGWHEYRHHINFTKVHGDQEQAKYVIDKYPKRVGVKTYVIGGNHDDSYASSKVDRVSLVAKGFQHQGRDVQGRDDIIYVGQYSHYLIFPHEVRVHLLHPRGSQAYSKSYKQQKRAEAFPKNARPEVQFSGHYHTYCHITHDGTHMIACPGMQDETELSKRLGFASELGFLIIYYKIDSGRLIYLSPRLYTV
jgi:predicted phosphodiesterase